MRFGDVAWRGQGDRQLLSSLVLTASSALSELPGLQRQEGSHVLSPMRPAHFRPTYGPEQLTEMSDLPATSAQGEAGTDFLHSGCVLVLEMQLFWKGHINS